MIDVHVPHATHTWKDFWIHLGTIAAGLLIAISLEQSVEALHRLHERHQLQEDLRAEGERDHAVVEGDLRTLAVERVWLLGLRDEVDRMRASGGKLKLPYPAKPVVDPDSNQPLPVMTSPSDAVWSTAKASSSVALLPRAQAEVYARLAWQHEVLVSTVFDWLRLGGELASFEEQFDDAEPASTPDLSRMTPAELDQYRALITRNLAIRDAVANRLKIFDAEARAILGGAASEDDLVRMMTTGKFEFEK